MGSPVRPAIQLYSVREWPDSLGTLIRRVGAAGFEGVEFSHRFVEEEIDSVVDALAETGLEPVAAHAELSAVEAAIAGESDLLERCESVGCDRIVIPHIGPTQFRTRQAVRSLSARLTEVAEELDTHDIDLGYHNMRHDLWPLLPDETETLLTNTPIPAGVFTYAAYSLSRLQSRPARDIPSKTGFWNLLARTTPETLCFELEVAEIKAAGFDPRRAFALTAGRTPSMHLRDVAPTGRFGRYVDVPHGTGVVDFETTVEKAANCGVEWAVYEDETDREPREKIDQGAGFMNRLLGETAEIQATKQPTQ